MQASHDFAEIRKHGTGKSSVLAEHFIVSFKQGEITPERALQLGQEICEQFLKGEYQYFMTCHIDKEHCHLHVVFNNTNCIDGRTFETHENRRTTKQDRSFQKLMNITDEVCRQHHLSVIDHPEMGRGKSHWEWELDKQNLSWKEQLKRTIDEVIKVSEDFEDFLAKCAEYGILVDYNPDHKIDLKFMLAEQKERNPRAKFTRAKTLGYFYESKQIARRIESYKYQMSHSPTARIIRTTADKFQQSQGLTNWADRENMKAASKALNEMTASNSTLEELESAAHTAFAKRMTATNAMDDIKEKFDRITEQIPVVEEYFKYRGHYQHYLSLTGKEKQKFAKNCSYELEQYKAAFAKVKTMFPDTKTPTAETLRKQQTELREQFEKRSAEYNYYKKEADRLARQIRQKRDSQKTIDRYLQNEQAAKRKKNQLE